MKYLKRFNESLLYKNRKFCGECGTKLATNDSFCGECGQEQESSETMDPNHTSIPKIVINDIIMAKDGGTLSVESTHGIFTVDRQIGTKTPYKITKPSRVKGNPNQIALDTEVKGLINSLKEYMKKTNQKFIQDYIDGIEDNLGKYSYPAMK